VVKKALLALFLLALGGQLALADKHVARVSIVDARKIALSQVPGQIVKEKLKHKQKKHHDRWVYQIKIKPKGEKGDQLKKVTIDADTGKILKIKDKKAKQDQDD
jgi:uncharacterized membrane protein YkoI